MPTTPTLSDIREAHRRIESYIHRTPVHSSRALNSTFESELFFKCENFQKTGSFKIRGASNAVFSLSDEQASKGVATHSSGNFAQALSQAAKWRGIRAYIVMPENSSAVKIEAVRGYGGEITFCKPTLEARESGLEEVVVKTGATFIHPYNNHQVIAGQGTAALELCGDVSNLDLIIAPIGGGGLMSGTALAVSALSPKSELIGAEPEGADDAYRSLQARRIIPSVNPTTIADGLRTSLGTLTFPIIKKYVKEIITVSDEVIIKAMRMIWERMKLVVEPSAAITLGAIMTKPQIFRKKRIGIILSGGNVDLKKLPW